MEGDDLLTQFKESYDKLKADNKILGEMAARVPGLQETIDSLVKKFDHAKKTKTTIGHIHNLEQQILAQKEEIKNLQAALGAATFEIQQLKVIVDNDQKLIRIKALEEWLFAIAEKVGIKSSSNVSTVMNLVGDAIRKMASK